MADSTHPPFLVLGLDHRVAELELREKLYYKRPDGEDLLVRLLAQPEIQEAALLSTCNRTELYLLPRDEEAAYRTAFDLTLASRDAELESQGRFYVKRREDAARHLCRVACGLKSMVLGEPEILGQVKQAAEIAGAVGSSGALLSRLLRVAVAAGRRARAATAIGGGAVSLGYATIELARNIFDRLENRRVLMVGAGQMAGSVTQSLFERGIGHLTVTNRSSQRLIDFRQRFPDAEAQPFDQRLQLIGDADLVVATTSADEPVFSAAELRQAMRERSSRPLLIVDLGVPRNIDPQARRISNLFLHDIDTLNSIIDRNLQHRRQEIPRVEEIIDEELQHFFIWYRNLAVEPVIGRLQKQAERIRRRELQQAKHHFPEETHEALDLMTRSLVRKILHHPSTRLRRHPDGEELVALDLVQELFQLEIEPADE